MTEIIANSPVNDRIRVAVQAITWNIPRGDDFEPWLDEVVEAGYDGVALFSMQVEDFINDPDRLRSLLDDRGLGFPAVTGFVSDSPEWAERVMAFMQRLGVRHLACTDFDPTLTLPKAVEILDERSRASVQYGVNVYYHNHTKGVGETMTALEELMGALDPGFAHWMLDVGHATKDFPEVPPSERAITFLDRHWDRIEYLELKDWNEVTDLNTPLGEGYADYDRIFDLIRKRGYPGGWLTVEQNGNDGPSLGRSPLESAKVSRAFVARHGY
jgi:sugar phosphate isomerase/epimerase